MSLVEEFDAALFDLDGVLYVGPEAVIGAPEAVSALAERGVRLGYVTNNASRTPQTVAAHLAALGMPARADDVVTSAQAIARVLAVDLPPASRVLVVGSQALAAELSAVGLAPVSGMDDDPVAVVQGYNPDWTVKDLQEACVAVHAGLPWYASNLDLTIPTARGLMPGMGTWVNVVSAATKGSRPVAVAGKPYRPLLDATVERIGCSRPIFVGDRLDTDIEGARTVGMASLFVLTGAHGKADLVAALPQQRPDHLGWSVAALAEEPVVPDPGLLSKDGSTLRLSHPLSDRRSQITALWTIAQQVWQDPSLDASAALDQLDQLP